MRIRIHLITITLLAYLCSGCWAVDSDVQQLLDLAPDPADYPNDAQALVVDSADYTLHEDGSVTERVHRVTMVLNERGREGGEAVTFAEDHENVVVLRARTIRSSGEVVEIAPDDIHTTSVFAGFDLYEDIKRLRFTYPAIEDGVLMEFEYERKIHDPLLPGYVNFAWTPQGGIPQVGSELRIRAPADRDLQLRRHNGASGPGRSTSKDGRTLTYHWSWGAYPAIESEPYMPSYDEIRPWVSVLTAYRWDDVAAVLSRGVEGKAVPDDAIRAAAAEICEGAADDEDKIRRIYYWIQNNTRDVGASLLDTRFDARSAPEVFLKRYGNDQALVGLMIAMLDAVGIGGRWAFVDRSSRAKTLKNEPPSFGRVADCICLAKVGDKEYWVDPTAQCRPLGELPLAATDRPALVMGAEGHEYMRTPKREYDGPVSITITSAELSPNGDARVRVSGKYLFGSASAQRRMYKYAKPDKIEESFRSAVQSKSASGTLIDYAIPDWRDFENPVRTSYVFDAPGWVRAVGDYLIVRPNASQRASEREDPFPDKERKYDIAFGASQRTRVIFTVTIPKGFEIDSVPEDFVRRMEFGDVTIGYFVRGRRVTVWSDTEYRAATLDKSRLPEVRQFFVDVGKRGRDAIVLKRTE